MKKDITSRRNFLKLGVGAGLASISYFPAKNLLFSRQQNTENETKKKLLKFSWLRNAEAKAYSQKTPLVIPANSEIEIDDFFESRVPIQSQKTILRSSNSKAQLLFSYRGVEGESYGLDIYGTNNLNAPVFRGLSNWFFHNIQFKNFETTLLIEGGKKIFFSKILFDISTPINLMAINNVNQILVNNCIFINRLGGGMEAHLSKKINFRKNTLLVKKAAIFLGSNVSGIIKNNAIAATDIFHQEKIFSTEIQRSLIVQNNTVNFVTEA